ncbi:MAG: hypothetical protein ACOYEQ_02210 [Bacillota bacterium]|jgi:hypothetical protein
MLVLLAVMSNVDRQHAKWLPGSAAYRPEPFENWQWLSKWQQVKSRRKDSPERTLLLDLHSVNVPQQ